MNRRHALKSSGVLAGIALLFPVRDLYAISPTQRPTPFHINFGKDRIADLHRRIDNMNWPEMPFDTGWSAGTNDKVLKDLVRYWRHEYDWFKEQEKLNQLPHFKLLIEGEHLHFVHYKGTGQRKAFPLLLMHGWPSSFLEFRAAAPLLLKEGFDLVVPSLPGFTFSDIPKQAGLHPRKMAERIHQLMHALGYERYGLVGNDWGGVINNAIASQHTASIVGRHYLSINFRTIKPDEKLTAQEQELINLAEQFSKEGTGYGTIQSTKPQTLSYGLQDSPVGLLAWILEKNWAWTDHGDDMWDTLDRNTVLTNVMLYWLTGRVYSASRIYYENRKWNDNNPGQKIQKLDIPTAWTSYPNDPLNARTRTRSLGDTTLYNIVRYTKQPRGGHHPAMEQPVIWANDVAEFFSSLTQQAK